MNQYRNSRVFVSGGAGVIGSMLVDRLHKNGALLFVGDLKPKPKHWPEDILYREGDLNTIQKERLLDFEPEYYFHLAATFERTFESYEFWRENFHHNIKLSHHLLDCLKELPELKRIVFASSYLIYDPGQYLLQYPPKAVASLSEESVRQPRNLCGMAKLLHEQELAFVAQYHPFSAISARIFRGYGRGSRDIISRWVRSLLKGETIDIYRPEGTFDFIFADEIAEGLMRLALTQQTGIVNLGSGKAQSISEVLHVLKGYFPGMNVNEIESDIPYEASQADMRRFQKWTGWLPEGVLEKGIAEVIAFEKSAM